MQKRRFLEYAVSTAAVLTAVAITVLSEPWIARQTLFVFLGAVLVSATYGGFWPGLYALGLAAVMTALFVVRPLNDFSMEDGGARWILFQIIAFLVVLMASSRRKAVKDLGESGERLRLALEVARTGVWDYARQTGELWLSPGMLTMIGQPDWKTLTYDQFLDCVHPDDRELFVQAVQRTLNDRVDYEVDFRVLRPDESIRHLAMRGRTYTSSAGQQRLVGVVTDKSGPVPSVSVSSRTAMRSSRDAVHQS